MREAIKLVKPIQVALVGGGGFIGTNLAYRLATDLEFEPVVYDTTDHKLRLRFGDVPMCRFVTCDIADDRNTLHTAVAEADIVVNLVAHVLPKRFMDAPLDVVDLNLHASLNVVRACIRHRKRLLHFSSCEVYGKTGGRTGAFAEDETDCILGPVANHRWIYSNAKQLLDRIIHAHGLRGDLDYTIVRPFNFVGPMMDWLGDTGDVPRVFASFMSALLNDQPIPLVDGGHSRRCFTYIDDAMSALVTILENPRATRNQIINIGNPGNETTISDLADLMRDIYHKQTGRTGAALSESVAGTRFYGPGYEDCDRRMPDIRKMQALEWVPQYDLRQTFEASIRFCLENETALRSSRPATARRARV